MCIVQIKSNYVFAVTVFLLHNFTGVIVTSKYPVCYRSLIWKHGCLSQICRVLICLYIPQYSLKCDHLPMIQTQDFWLASIHIKHVQHIAKRFTHSCTFLWFGTCQFSHVLQGYHDDVIKWKVFRVTDHLCGEFTGPRWIPRTKASDAELWCFLWSASE